MTNEGFSDNVMSLVEPAVCNSEDEPEGSDYVIFEKEGRAEKVTVFVSDLDARRARSQKAKRTRYRR